MIKSLVICLCLTLIIELAVSFLLGIRQKNDFLLIICANICTNPMVVYLSNGVALLDQDILYIFTVAILEIFAFSLEFIIYKKGLIYDKLSPLVVSFINNATSFGLGLMITNIF